MMGFVARIGSILVLLTPFGASACADRRPAAALPERRDSSGIIIFEGIVPDSRGAEWRIAEEPELTIGVVEGDRRYEMEHVRDAAVLSDGRIAVVDWGANQLRVYGHDGSYEFAVGGQGGGPGRLNRPTDLTVLPGDTLAVLDRTQGFSRSFFTSSGTFIRRQTVTPAFLDTLHFTGQATLLGDASVLFRVASVSYMRTLPRGVSREPVGLVRLEERPGGTEVDTIAWFEGQEFYSTVVGDEPMGTATLLGPSAVWTSGGAHVYVADTGTGEVHGYDYSGGLKLVARYTLPREPVTPEQVKQGQETFLEQMPTQDGPRWRRYFDGSPRPSEHPAIQTLVADPEGDLWLQAFPSSSTQLPSWWVIRSIDGSVVAVDFPRRLEVMEVGSDYVLGLWRDEQNVQFVQKYRLEKSSS